MYLKQLHMNIKEKFLQLTSHTYPHGTEDKLFDFLPKELQFDEFGNLFLQIGKSDVMFTSHLDTATSADCPVKHVFEKENGVDINKYAALLNIKPSVANHINGAGINGYIVGEGQSFVGSPTFIS